MRRAHRIVPFVLLVSMLGLLPARAEPRSGFHLEDRVPANTLLFASLENVGTWESRWNATAMGKMMNDPEMRAFFTPMMKTIEQLAQQGMAELPPMAMEAIGMLSGLKGQLALALIDIDPPNEQVKAALSIDFGDQVQDFMKFLDRMRTEMDPQGRVQTEQRDGRTWWHLDTGEVPIHASTADTTFVVTTDAALLGSILAGPSEGSLGSQEEFLGVRRRAGGGDLAMFAYGNVKAALARFGDMVMGPRERHIANALGLDTVSSVAYGMAFKDDGFRDTVMVHAPGADHGLLPIFQMKPLTAPRTLDLVPAGAFWWMEANLPTEDLVARVRGLLQAIDPDLTQSMDDGLGMAQQMLAVDVEKELLAGLSGTVGAYAALSPTGGLYPEVALVMPVKDAATYEGIFDRLTTSIAGLLNEEGDVLASTRVMEYHGARMHLFEMQAARGDDVVPFTPTWAILGDRLIVTLVPHAMKEIVLRAQGITAAAGLATREDFRALMASKPADAGAMEYVNLKGVLSVLYDTAVPLLQTIAKPNVLEDVPFPIDWAQLPPASRMAPYFRSMAGYSTWNENGLVTSYQGPVPMMPIVLAAVGAAAFVGMRAPADIEWATAEAVPMVPGGGFEDEMDVELATIQAEILLDQVAQYRVTKGELPTSQQQLLQAKLIQSVVKDPWGGLYWFEGVDGGGFAVVSSGPDGKPGTQDDVRAEGE